MQITIRAILHIKRMSNHKKYSKTLDNKTKNIV